MDFLTNGIYLYPKTNRFGIECPSINELAKAIAKRDSARIIPSGMTEANMLGLSEQVTHGLTKTNIKHIT